MLPNSIYDITIKISYSAENLFQISSQKMEDSPPFFPLPDNYRRAFLDRGKR